MFRKQGNCPGRPAREREVEPIGTLEPAVWFGLNGSLGGPVIRHPAPSRTGSASGWVVPHPLTAGGRSTRVNDPDTSPLASAAALRRIEAKSGQLDYGNAVVIHDTQAKHIRIVPFYVSRSNGSQLHVRIEYWRKKLGAAPLEGLAELGSWQFLAVGPGRYCSSGRGLNLPECTPRPEARRMWASRRPACRAPPARRASVTGPVRRSSDLASLLWACGASGQAAAQSPEAVPAQGQGKGEVDRGLDQLNGPVAARGLVGDGDPDALAGQTARQIW
jgi:hypothetical protein